MLRRVPGTSCEKRQNRVEALEQPLGSEELRPRGGELDREREAVQATADRLDRGVERDLPPDRSRPLREQCGRLIRRQRFQPILLLARHVQWRPAGDEHPDIGTGAEDGTDRRGGVEEVLEVVEKEQKLSPRRKPVSSSGAPIA